jgi:hypothetical protein
MPLNFQDKATHFEILVLEEDTRTGMEVKVTPWPASLRLKKSWSRQNSVQIARLIHGEYYPGSGTCVVSTGNQAISTLNYKIYKTHKKEPTRCNRVLEFIIPVFLNCSTCFGRHTDHHQELKNCNCSSGFTYVYGCRSLRWLNHRSGRQP